MTRKAFLFRHLPLPTRSMTGFLAGALLLIPVAAHAAPERAVQLILDEKWAAARSEVVQSGNPVLIKLYEWNLYRDNQDNLPYDQVVDFIQKNPTWPDQKKLLGTAERTMPDNLAPSQVIQWFYLHPAVTGKGIDRLLQAGQATGQSVIPLANDAWPAASMSQKTQTEIMQRYGRVLSINAHLARLDYLMKAESYTLARSLGESLGGGYPKLVEARIALVTGKSNARDAMNAVPQNLANTGGFVLDRIRWLRKNNDNVAAANLLDTASHTDKMTFPEDWWKERNILVRRLIEDKNYSKAYHLASQHQTSEGPEFADAEWMSGWLALRFLNRPDLAMQHFTRMYGSVDTAISKARGAYWAGRTADALKKPTATAWYQDAASYPHTYYGQVARTHLHLPAPNLTAAQASTADQAKIQSSDLVQVAALLYQTGHESLSAKFVSAEMDHINTAGEFQALATYLKKLGDTSGAYRVAKRASWKNIFLGDTAYPSLMKWIGNLNIDPALAHGIIRQESQFDPTAESPVGAKGLMQLMPATAKEIAQKRGWDHQTDWLVTRPDYNILLGSAYLNDLLERFNGSYPLAIAAYNAGPSRVKGWLDAFGDPRTGRINWIDWLELIPVSETRNYVQRVTEGIVTYRDHLGMIKK